MRRCQMKKIVLALALSIAAWSATTVKINSGWNLVGAIGSITPSQIPCAQTVWTYEGGAWKLYTSDGTDTNNYGFTPLTSIQEGQGFWVNAGTNACSVDFSNLTYVPTVGQMYLDYGLVVQDRKSDARYTIPGNTVSYDETAKTFTLTAVKNSVSDSRAGILLGGWTTPQPLSVVEATLNLQTTNTGSTANRAQLNIGKIPLTHFLNAKASAGAILSSQGIDVWYEIDFDDGNYSNIYSQTVSVDNMIGKNVTVKAYVDGKNIKFDFSGDYIGSHTINTAQLFHNDLMADINGGINYAELRSRVKVDSFATENSVVTVSDVKIAPYMEEVSGVASAVADFATLGNFIILGDEEDPNYMSFVKSGTNFTANEYFFNGSTWENDGSFSGTVSGNRLALPTGFSLDFEIFHTLKVDNFSDLYMHFSKNTVVTESNNYESYTWNWINPSYYDATADKQVSITDLNSLIAAFTTGNTQGGGVHFGDDATPMFLVQTTTTGKRAGNVVLGKWTGEYYQNTDRIFVRTDIVVGTWIEGAGKINVETPQQSITFEVANGQIVEGDKDKLGASWYDVILSGTDANETNVRSLLTTP